VLALLGRVRGGVQASVIDHSVGSRRPFRIGPGSCRVVIETALQMYSAEITTRSGSESFSIPGKRRLANYGFASHWHQSDSSTRAGIQIPAPRNRSLSFVTFRCTRRIQPTRRRATPPWQRCSLLRSSEHSRNFKRWQTQSKIKTEGASGRVRGTAGHTLRPPCDLCLISAIRAYPSKINNALHAGLKPI
jgi:hypothetical protein